MEDLLEVIVRIDNKEFLKCNYIQLVSNSRTSLRTVIFKNIKLINKDVNLLSGEYDFCVAYKNQKLERKEVHWFDMYMIFSDMFTRDINDGDDIEIKSIMTHDKHIFYQQDVIDIYNLWQHNKEVNWNEIDTDFKYSYVSACFYWSKTPSKFINYEIVIDCLMIKEQIDLFYYLGREMFGERAYCGSGFYQFEDCISMLRAKGLQKLTLVIFRNFNQLESESIINDINHLITFFKSIKIEVQF
ncbi:hypothetical protein [Chryseobacterium sp. JV558]|uniref:hypothetical protein n=1 Tax=Chryseobacterium sp. JV558 TaxID=2663236 RepID=UPI00299DB5A0|nr:hypothetical protein [Chryseobacterium sp. JV558]MDW9382598.1 hypothetical protein [Chryseobacterium sp. JV558]